MSKASADALLEAFKQNDHAVICEHLHSAKTQIKREAVEASAVSVFFHAIRLGLSSEHPQIVTQTLSLAHGAIRRLNIQDPPAARQQISLILDPLIEAGRRLTNAQGHGNNSRGVLLLRDCISAAAQTCSSDVERILRDTLSTSNPLDTRLFGIALLDRLASDTAACPVPRWTASLLSRAADDPNDNVRSTARRLLTLLQDRHAHPDVERMNNPRPPIATGVDGMSGADRARSLVSSQREGSVAGSIASTYLGSVPGSEMEHVDARQVHNAKDLESELAAMLPSFEGRESEKNWLLRERNVTHLRALLRGNAVNDHLAILVAGLKGLLDGIVKAMSSLRTSLCLNALQLVKDLAIVLRSAANPLTEQLFGAMVKLTALTKKIAASAANVSICVVLAHCSCWNRFLQQIVLAVSDKNVAPRLYAASWLRFILEAQSEQHALDHQSIEALDKAQRKLLGDANPGVREAARVTFWQFATQFPDRGEQILSSLEPAARKQLERAGNRSDQGTGQSAPASGAGAAAPAINSSGPAQAPRVRAEHHADQKSSLASGRAALGQGIQIGALNGGGVVPDAITRPGGLSSGSVRPGLGSARRPMPATSVAAHAATAVKSSSANTVPNAVAMPAAPELLSTSPIRLETERPSPRRRKAIVDQLEHEDWRERVEGVVILACLLAKRDPPAHDGLRYTLPAMDVLRPVLRKLMADPQSEVFNHLVAPEVVGEVAKIIDWENILPRMLLLAETDEPDQGHDIKSNCLPATKNMFSEEDAVQMCLEILALLKVTGHSGKLPRSVVKFTPTQKRHIIRGVLHWLIELGERHQAAVSAGAEGNPAVGGANEYKLLMNRTMSMMTNIQPSSINYVPLASFLRLLRAIDGATFDRNLSTFERSIVVALRKAWGEQVAEEEQAIREEPIAGVEQVLGRDPSIWGEDVAQSDLTLADADADDSRSSESDRSAGDGLTVEDAALDLTVVNLSRWNMPPKTPAAVRKAMAEIDSPFSPLKPQRQLGTGKENDGGLRSPGKQSEKATKAAFRAIQETPVAKLRAEPRGLLERLRADAALDDANDAELSSQDDAIRAAYLELHQGSVQVSSWAVLLAQSKSRPAAVLDAARAWLVTEPRSVKEASRMALLLCSVSCEGDDAEQLAEQLALASARLCLAAVSIAGTLQHSIGLTLTKACERASPSATLSLLLEQLPRRWLEDAASPWPMELEKLLVVLDGLTRLVERKADCTIDTFKGALATVVRKSLSEDLQADTVLVAQVRRASVNLALAMHRALGRNSGKVFAALDGLLPAQHNLLMYYFEQQ